MKSPIQTHSLPCAQVRHRSVKQHRDEMQRLLCSYSYKGSLPLPATQPQQRNHQRESSLSFEHHNRGEGFQGSSLGRSSSAATSLPSPQTFPQRALRVFNRAPSDSSCPASLPSFDTSVLPAQGRQPAQGCPLSTPALPALGLPAFV